MSEDTDDFLAEMAEEMEPKICKSGEENKELAKVQKEIGEYMRDVVAPQVRRLERETAAELARRRMRGW
jgi:membrane protease subunit (stomatin/prohibitin family)